MINNKLKHLHLWFNTILHKLISDKFWLEPFFQKLNSDFKEDGVSKLKAEFSLLFGFGFFFRRYLYKGCK